MLKFWFFSFSPRWTCKSGRLDSRDDQSLLTGRFARVNRETFGETKVGEGVVVVAVQARFPKLCPEPSSMSFRRIGFESNLPSTIPLSPRKGTWRRPSFSGAPLFSGEDDRFKYSRELDYRGAPPRVFAIPHHLESCVSAGGEKLLHPFVREGNDVWDVGGFRMRFVWRLVPF